MNDLIEIDDKTVERLFMTGDGVGDLLAQIENIVLCFESESKTKIGRAKTVSFANKIAKFKVRLDNIGKEMVSDWKQKAKAVDQRRKILRDGLDHLKTVARAPVDEWEANETQRVAELEERVANLEVQLSLDVTADEIKQALEYINGIVIDHSWQEYEGEAHERKAATVSYLQDALVMVQQREEREREAARQQAELERQAKEKEAIEAQLREEQRKAEKAKWEAEEAKRKAQQEAERIRLEAERAKLQAEQARLEAERQAEQAALKAQQEAIDAENRRQAEEAERKRQEIERQAQIKATAEWRARVWTDILDAIKPMTHEDIAQALIDGRIPHVKVDFT